MKKIFLMLAATAIAFSVVSCNGTSSKGNTVTVWAMGAEGLALGQMISKFEEQNPDIKIDLQAIPWDVADQNIMMAVATGDGPDVIGMGSTWVANYGKVGALLDFTPYVDQHPIFSPDNYFDGTLETAIVDGKLVGIPWYVETRVLFYRTDILREVGRNRPPETWDELLQVSRAMGNRGTGFFGLDIDPKNSDMTIMLARQNGSRLIDTETNTALFNQPEFVDAVRFVNQFFKEGHSDASGMYTGTFPFGDGYIPMQITGPWSINTIMDLAPEIAGKFSLAMLPMGPLNRTSVMGGSHLVVLKSAKNIDGAMQFIDFLVQPENQIAFFETVNALPSNIHAWELDSALNTEPIYGVLGEQLKDAVPYPTVGAWETIFLELHKAMERINIGGEDIQTVMDETNATAQNLLDR